MAVNQYPEERISPYTLGIDFGTCNSSLAVYKKGVVEFLPIEGQTVVPSVVTFRDKKVPLIGSQAKNSALLYPERTISSIKMQLGNDEWTFTHGDRTYSAADIAALVLGHLKEGAHSQDTVDLEGTVKRVVLCVPANFESNKRELLLCAARDMVGWDVKLLEEPVAAAIAYASQREASTRVLVYDLGGGTFDVCILEVVASADPDIANHFKVLGKGGISKLGGDDFDQVLMNIFAAKIREDSGLDLFDLTKDQGVSIKKLKAAQQTIKVLAEKVKMQLSEADNVSIDEPNVIKDESGKVYGLSDFKVSREEFLSATRELLARTEQPVVEALKEANLEPDDIDRIILVGGSTKMCGVKDFVKEKFGKEPWSEINPVTIVAQGAALYAAGGILEQNRTSHFLGVELLHQKFGRLIDKNAPLPAVAEKIYQAAEIDPEAIRIAVYQSMEPVEYTTETCATFLGEFFLVIPEEKRKKEFRNIQVNMEMTQENLLKVRAQLEDEGGVFHEIEIRK